MRITTAGLATPTDRLPAMERFYRGALGLQGTAGDRGLDVLIGDARLRFEASPGAPFYHVALLVPGDRFDAARAWLAARAPLLSRPGSDETVFDFAFWDALACYAHDPAGNIVELIAHRGVAETGSRDGEFTAGEISAISEVGMVVPDTAAAARTLGSAGLPLWSGDVRGADALGFVGGKAHTLILCAVGRPWLPTRRPAETHPVRVTMATGGAEVDVRLDASGGVETHARP